MKKIKIGIIGAGKITKDGHLKAIQHLNEEVEVSAIADINIAAAQTLAKEYNIPSIYSDYNDLLKNENVDAVLISVPNYLHSPIAIEAMKKGKHVLCEKPLAINSEEANKMVNIQKQTNRILMVAYHNLFRSDIEYIKKSILENKLGKIYYGKCGWIRRAGIPSWGNWFTDKEKSGGGPLIDIGVHMLDLVLYLMDYPKPVSVFGSAFNIFGRDHKGMNRARVVADENGIFNVEDFAVALIRFENGVTILIETSWAANIESDSIYLSILGDKAGAGFLNDSGPYLYMEEKGTQLNIKPQVLFDYEGARIKMWHHFAECIRNNTKPISSAENGLLANKILDAIYESSKSGREIIIESNKGE